MAGGLICIFLKYIPAILPCRTELELSDPKSAVSCSCSPCKCAEREQVCFFPLKLFSSRLVVTKLRFMAYQKSAR